MTFPCTWTRTVAFKNSFIMEASQQVLNSPNHVIYTILQNLRLAFIANNTGHRMRLVGNILIYIRSKKRKKKLVGYLLYYPSGGHLDTFSIFVVMLV